MRKYFPVIVFFMVFTGFLAAQVAFDIVTSSRQSNTSEAEKIHHDGVFHKQILNDTRGESIALAEVEAPVVIINFWASWCTPCLVELPSLVKISQKYGSEKILILGINSDEIHQNKKIEKMVAKYKIKFPIIPDKGEILDAFKVSKIPTTLIFQKGKLVKHIDGMEDFISEEMIEFFDDLLK